MGIIDKSSKAFSLRDACLGVNMNDMEQAVNKAIRGGGSPFPPALAPNVLAWWDAGFQRDVMLPFTQAEWETDGTALTGVFGTGNTPTSTEFTAIKAADVAAGNPQTWTGTLYKKVNPSGKYYAYDASKNNRFAKLYNMAYTAASGPQAGPPKHWKGDGVDDWMGRAQSGFIAEDADFSCFSCFRPVTDGGTCWLNMAQATAFDVGEVVRMYYQSGGFSARLYDRVSGYPTVNVAGTVLASSFYIFGLSYTHADKKFWMYVNGVLIGESAALSNGHAAISFVRNFRSGPGTAYTAHPLGVDGWFSKALSLSEWKAIHNRLAPRFGLTPVI